MGKGGIERKLIYLLQDLLRKKYSIVLVFGQERVDDFWNLPPDVKVVNLAKQQNLDFYWRPLFPSRVYKLSTLTSSRLFYAGPIRSGLGNTRPKTTLLYGEPGDIPSRNFG